MKSTADPIPSAFPTEICKFSSDFESLSNQRALRFLRFFLDFLFYYSFPWCRFSEPSFFLPILRLLSSVRELQRIDITISGRRLSRELICDSMLSPQSWDNTWIFIDNPDKNESRSSVFPIRSMDVLIHLYTSNWLSEKSDKFDRFILSFLKNAKIGIKEPRPI